MALPAKKAAKPLLGHASPRIAPPRPLRSDIGGFRETAAGMGIQLMPWQDTAALYLTATNQDGGHLYPEVAIVVARQNGKTTLMKPLIIRALREGKRILHIAQTRELPRHMFGIIADALSQEPELFPKRRGKTIWPRYGAGQEEIVLVNGGTYRIAAADTGGARGQSMDIVIIDELREMKSDLVISSAAPTLMMSPDPQMIYLSNAGHDGSVVLNSIRARRDEDPALAYLEWSAAPERKPDDVAGWAEANPALGHFPSVHRHLETEYRRHKLGGTLAIFETEHLCRWVVSMRERLVDDFEWSVGEVDELPESGRRFLGVSMDPKGGRASAVLAWRMPDEVIAVRSLGEYTGSPIDTDELGKHLRELASKHGVVQVGFDPLTDKELAKFFRKTEAISGQAWANASARFALAVGSRKLRWTDSEAVTQDLVYTTRKAHDESGSYQAVRADDDRPITASLAAIRAVWLASQPALTTSGF